MATPPRSRSLKRKTWGRGISFIALTGLGQFPTWSPVCWRINGGWKRSSGQISREDYLPLAEMSGVTAAITPRLLTVSTVLKLVRASNVLSISLLIRVRLNLSN